MTDQELKEYVLRMLDGLRREIELIRESDTRALELQAKEYERRLTELNGAHKIAVENWRTAVPREVFEGFRDGLVKWQGGVNDAITTHSTTLSTSTANTRRLMALLGAALIASGGLISAYVAGNSARLEKLELKQTEVMGIQHERGGRFEALERRVGELEGRRR